jgi:hypothetical protein
MEVVNKSQKIGLMGLMRRMADGGKAEEKAKG